MDDPSVDPSLDRRLLQSGWLDRASLREAASGGPACAAEVVLNASGHEFISGHGIRRFEQELAAGLGDQASRVSQVTFAAADIVLPWRDGGGFPRVLSKLEEEQRVRFLLDVRRDLIWFEGHFPGSPILPGIVQVHWAAIAGAACFGLEGPPGEVKRLKFKSPLVPPDVVELSISRPAAGELQFAYTRFDARYSEGRLVVGRAVA